MFSVHVLLSGSHSDAIDLKFCGQHRHVVSYHVQNQVLHSRFNFFYQNQNISNQWVSKSESSETKDLTANLRQGNQSIIVRPRAGTKKISLVGEPNVKPMRLKQNPSIWITQTIVQSFCHPNSIWCTSMEPTFEMVGFAIHTSFVPTFKYNRCPP